MRLVILVAIFPLWALGFVLRVEIARWLFGRSPAASGWAAVFGVLAAGAVGLTLLRSAPYWGDAFGDRGVAIAAYLAGMAVTAVVFGVLKPPQE